MRLPRPLTCLLAVAALAVVPAAALAQSAGDEQYQDPFGSSTTQTSSGSPSKGTGTTTNPGSTLTQAPQVSSGSTPSQPSGSQAPAPQATGGSTGQLARTGIDARLFLALGAALLLAGVGLRLRTIPERF